MKQETIRKVEPKRVQDVMCLIKEAVADMESHSIYQWDEVYPDHATIFADIDTETMFGVFINDELAGIVVLNNLQSPEYLNVNWELSDNNPLVMHRLCVRPKFQGQGIAKQLLKFSEQLAIINNYRSIRLDAFSENHSALHLYDTNGYKKRGTVTFRKGDFYCYEKLFRKI